MGGALVACPDHLVVSSLRCEFKMEYEEREKPKESSRILA